MKQFLSTESRASVMIAPQLHLNLFLRNDLEFDRYTILKYAKENGEDERMVKQRIRRAVKKAL
ncbi:MAG: hypothetical protein RSB02_08345, partial [Anaerovoracaceae bacterium]